MKNLKKIPYILSILSFLTFFTSVNAEIKVVASIKPIHSLASYLMDGVNKPGLIVDGYASPHGFALKPSHAKMLQDADLIFWVGEDLENFLEKPLGSIAKKAEKIELLNIKGLNKLKFRERNIFDGHDDHGHKEDEHKEDGHDDHGHEGHAHGEYDPHIWLDPANAKIILNEMVEHLIEEAQKMGFGTFLFNDCKDEGFVFDIDNLKMYSVGDFVDYVMKERHRTYTMLER